LKAGIIGAGHWGTKVVKEYIALYDEKLLDSVVLCDLDNSRLKPFANAINTSSSIDETLNKVNMLHICTPNFTHYEIAKKALESGVNVLIEKPMAEDVNHAFDLVKLSMSKGLILQVGHIFRFANIVRKIKQLYEEGEFGEIRYFNLSWTHLMPPMQNVDVVYDLLPHPIDMLNFITDKWPLSFIGIGKFFRRTELIEVASIEAVYDNFFANIFLSWVSPQRKRELELIGSKKGITADCVKQTATIYDGFEAQSINVDPNNTIRDEILNFIDAINTGKNDYNSSIVGARGIEMVNEAIKSIKLV
jgi:predicted dehydrogenase